MRFAQRLLQGSRHRRERRSQGWWTDLKLGDRVRRNAIEAARVIQQRGVAARAYLGEDGTHGFRELRVLRRVEACQLFEAGSKILVGGRKAFHLAARAKASISGCSSARLVLSAAWLTISRAETGRISSTATSPLSRSVRPVATRSTMASARPVSGASSIDP